MGGGLKTSTEAAVTVAAASPGAVALVATHIPQKPTALPSVANSAVISQIP
jgi:hypothetical protein